MNSIFKIIVILFLVLPSSGFITYDVGTFSSSILPLSVKDSTPYKNKGSGPRYWIAYEYCWNNNKPIPELEWKANIDWVITNFKSYGYDMVSNDGWIETAQTINSDGYITKYNDSWVNGFKYWSDYLSKKGMKLGIYYNPLWLTKAAYDQNIKIKGTNYRARDIVGATSFNGPLYWVDVSKPGAKEWIQGYIDYFKNTIGSNYLRVDFLENYERNYGTIKYAQALSWIKDAAGDNLFLSLVMPNCYNHGQTELRFGNMIRIDDDCFNGGWDFVSSRKRGEWKPDWPQYGNAFDGFVNFADISGRGQMILDGDFIRLNTLENDKERKFQVSLFTMAGSPITIADQYNSIGKSAWIYQNRELLELNDQGFAGKPLSYDTKDTVRSSTWVGQMPDGDWIVGFFNRESTPRERSFDFEKELGFSKGAPIIMRDLWAHKDLSKLSGIYSVNLAAHECRILRIKNNKNPKYQAEVASMSGGAKRNTDYVNYNGHGFVQFETIGSKVLFAIDVPSPGDYTLSTVFANASGIDASASIYVNNAKVEGHLNMPHQTNNKTWSSARNVVALNAGTNYITIQSDPGDKGLFKLDYIQILME